MRELLRDGADVNQADDEGCSPLYVACQNGHAQVVRASASSPAMSRETSGHSWLDAKLKSKCDQQRTSASLRAELLRRAERLSALETEVANNVPGAMARQKAALAEFQLS